MKKIVSFNVNGIRSAIRKGFARWLKDVSPDIVCLQELKAKEDQIDTDIFSNLGYNSFLYSAVKPGYSGVGILTKQMPLKVHKGIGIEKFDNEGRLIIAEFADYEIINTYFPSGSSGDVRQRVKMEWLDAFTDFVRKRLEQQKSMVICGDFNICRLWIDIHNPEGHLRSSGFLPEERQWFDDFMKLGFIDTFREFDDRPDQYSWWSFRAASRQRNKGWRIDYILISENLRPFLVDARIMKDVVMSDHSPVVVDLDK